MTITNEIPATCVGYVRFSTVQQAGESDETQRQIIHEYASHKSLRLVEIVSDPATSAKTRFLERPGGRRVDEMLRSGVATAVITTRIDRPWRNLVDCLMTLDDWHRRDIAAHIIAFNNGKPLDTSLPLERMMVSMLGALAEYERSLIGARVRESLESRKTRGLPWNHPPMGKSINNGILCENPDELRLINRVVELHRNGMKPSTIAKSLEKDGYRNRRGASKFQCIQIQRYLKTNAT